MTTEKIPDELPYHDKQIDILVAKVKELEKDVEHYRSAYKAAHNQAMANGQRARELEVQRDILLELAKRARVMLNMADTEYSFTDSEVKKLRDELAVVTKQLEAQNVNKEKRFRGLSIDGNEKDLFDASVALNNELKKAWDARILPHNYAKAETIQKFCAAIAKIETEKQQ